MVKLAIICASLTCSNASGEVNLAKVSLFRASESAVECLLCFLDGEVMRVDVAIDGLSSSESWPLRAKYRLDKDFLMHAGALDEYIVQEEVFALERFFVDLMITMASMIDTIDTITMPIANIINDLA